MWELDLKENWALKNWCFLTVVLEKHLESLLDWKEIKPVSPTGNQSWILIALKRLIAEAETPILWPPDVKNRLIGKDPGAGKDWRQEEKETTENETVNGVTSSMNVSLSKLWSWWTGSLACCSPWGYKGLYMTERLNWTDYHFLVHLG